MASLAASISSAPGAAHARPSMNEQKNRTMDFMMVELSLSNVSQGLDHVKSRSPAGRPPGRQDRNADEAEGCAKDHAIFPPNVDREWHQLNVAGRQPGHANLVDDDRQHQGQHNTEHGP